MRRRAQARHARRAADHHAADACGDESDGPVSSMTWVSLLWVLWVVVVGGGGGCASGGGGGDKTNGDVDFDAEQPFQSSGTRIETAYL